MKINKPRIRQRNKTYALSKLTVKISHAVETTKDKLERILKGLGSYNIETAPSESLLQALIQLQLETQPMLPPKNIHKKGYYITAELLPGRWLGNNLRNLGLYEEVQKLLQEKGRSLPELEELDVEANLGNGGLGRLAACYLSSAAALSIPLDGIVICYHFGLCKQRFIDMQQVAEKDSWISKSFWLKRRDDLDISIPFASGRVKAVVYDVPIFGALPNGSRNTLHLIDLEDTDEKLSPGDGIEFDKKKIPDNLSLFLYPDDNDQDGRRVRISQEYLLSSASAQLVLNEAKERGVDLHRLHEHSFVQLNDTHPAMFIPELVRLLLNEGFMMDEAISEAKLTSAYTNHTLMAESLERWKLSDLEATVPQIVPIIREMDNQVRRNNNDPELRIIDDNQVVHIAHLACQAYAVNGVAAMHTKLLCEKQLTAFYIQQPGKFKNITNGIDHHRWLLQSNPELTDLLRQKIGNDFIQRPERLRQLLAFQDDAETLNSLSEIKAANKRSLVKTLGSKYDINPDSIFIVQIKRIHLYKRQQMPALWIIRQYLDIKKGVYPDRPMTFFFAGKAHPSYKEAKDILTLILALEKLTAEDPDVSPWLRVVMPENYNVTLAERIIPAAEVSQQVSLAGREASGTGNMKLMMNGAITVGTLDGANVEIHDFVGDDNMFLFGKTADEIAAITAEGTYSPAEFCSQDSELHDIIKFIFDDLPELVGVKGTEVDVALKRVAKSFEKDDPFYSFLDYHAYSDAMSRMLTAYQDRSLWNRMSLVNIALSGWFSSYRSVSEYNKKIWHLK